MAFLDEILLRFTKKSILPCWHQGRYIKQSEFDPYLFLSVAAVAPLSPGFCRFQLISCYT